MKTLKRMMISFMILLLCSCSKKDPLIGTWEFIRIDTKNMENPEIYDDYFLQSAITFSGDQTFIMMNQGEDPFNTSKVSKDSLSQEEMHVYSGTWSVEDSLVNFEIHSSGKKQNFSSKIFRNDGRNMTFSIPKKTPFNEKDIKFKYKKTDYDDVSQSKEHPFTSQKLNSWRVKSDRKQTKQEIKAKTENALEFFIAFLEYHDEKEQTAMLYYMEPSPFKFYGNGIMLKHQQNAPVWNHLFYDEEDAGIAHSMLDESLKSVAKVPKEFSKSPIKINIYILKETLKNLKEMKV